MGESAVEHKTNQGIRVDDKSTGEEVANSEKQSKKVSIAEAEPPSSPTIIDLSTADVVLDKVFVIVNKATLRGKWFGHSPYSVSVEVIDGGCGPASLFTTSTVDDPDTAINESSLLLYKRVDHNEPEGEKLRISIHQSSGLKNLLTKDTISTTIPIPALGQLQELDVDLGNGAAILRLHLQSQLAEERIITKEQYEDFEYRQLLTDIGFDVFSIDLRRCGRAKLPDQDQLISHHSDDLTEYIEEIDMAWDLAMKVSGNTYKKVFFYGHSTGGLIVSMYHRKGTYRSKIDGLVFNSPFFALNLPKIIRKAVSLKLSVVGLGKGIQPITTGGGINQDLLSIWSQYYFETGKRTTYNLNLTKGWINACVNEQKSLKACPTDSGTPTLILTSRHDHTLDSASLLKMVDHVSTFLTEIELTYARHDVFLSPYPLINEEALGYLRAFLTQACQIKIKL